ncbi:Pycsar system effector family protein [Mucilaginibacter psychrotolerans]|uniref:Pycsar effector protein domain-containing protein n=1 Tax=Mucilaginibacter psychrotolerans TaxID=1524096 RepID=A0A4Y8SGN5_9SPHI|nr:Pycsar system effector family protein [Mucilaginibacter psychrotolerans]TFF37707.1 hypothetical protein E2R66_11100 [Mucilaginibacter psychrotolerans]
MYEPKHSDRYWQILQLNIEWLRFSETKATLVLTVYGVIFTMAYANASSVFTSLSGSGWLLFLVFFYGALSLTSIVFAFLCVNPALKNKNSKSIIYFGHIKKDVSEATYKRRAHSVIDDEEKFTDEITEQIHVISKIAWKKYRSVGWALRFFIGSLIILIVSVFLYLLHNL